ncbi:VWA domain-containing protein [bacterium]|nr:VWA domain-containing protein [bacterium]
MTSQLMSQPVPPVPTLWPGVPAPHQPLERPARASRLARLHTALCGATGQSMGIALLLVGGGFVIAGTVVVMRYIIPPPMMFQPAKKMPALQARALEHRIRVKQFDQQAQRPKIVNKLVSKGAAKIALPPLPAIKPAQADVRSLPSVMAPAGGHLGQIGLGGIGIGKGGAGALQGFSEAEFFGHRIQTRSVIILADSSSSVVKKGAFDDLRAEAVALASKLHPDTRFNLIIYTDGALAFAPEMVYASHAAKSNLVAWMHTKMRENAGNEPGTSGSTPLAALRAALAMQPDTIVLITDDPPMLSGVDQEAHVREIMDLVRSHQQAASQRVTINTVAYKSAKTAWGEKARVFLRDLARATGGRFREVSALRAAVQ